MSFSWNLSGDDHGPCAPATPNPRPQASLEEPANVAVMWDSHNPWTDCLTTSTCFIYNRDVTAFLEGQTLYRP